ncbi:Asp-tRNA(Asn)/Glu-tRNA(Gln) amidotransferase subunit GatA [Candidatus Woesearchaeota archaeon]|nr:Asp-tRNA(Asn)/Glu-tRNA(Gln) amidotransferase subunit GatA [Candidatus Woesearchaeota archaeon]
MVREKRDHLLDGKISASENIHILQERIRELDRNINSFLHVNEKAVEDAKEVDLKIREGNAGKLAGLAIAVKANINVRGLPASCASKTLANYISTYDADAVRMIRENDGVVIGIANCDEFACGSSGESSAFGATNNPAAPGMIPGGSSSGSAASVAAGMCDIALGSDTGGSIRNPASHCGIVGIKPSYGRVSRFGLIDLSMSLDQIGPLSRDVHGSALLLEAISGKTGNDPATTENEVESYSDFKKPRGLRIGMSSDFERMCTDKRIHDKISAFAQSFSRKTGSELKEIELKYVDLSVQAYYPIVYTEFFSGTRKFDGRKYGRKIEESCGEEVLRRILGGMEISKSEYHGAYYRKALAAKQLISKDFENAFRNTDIIMLPTTPILPHKIGTKITDPRTMYAYDAFTIPANLSGICAGVINIGRIEGIPVGLQVMAPAFNEKLLFDVLRECEVIMHGD